MGLQRTITTHGEKLIFTFPDGTGEIIAVRGTGGSVRLDMTFPGEVRITHVDAAGFTIDPGDLPMVKE